MHRLRRVEVRHGGLDGIAALRDRAVRHPHHNRNPGFFRTELLTKESTTYAELSIGDYDERRAKQLEFWKGQNGKQGGDPAKLSKALITIASQEPPPVRFIAGADAIALVEQKVAALKEQIDAYRELSTSLALD